MHWIKDHVFAPPAPWVTGDDITAAANDHLIDIATKPDIAVAIGNRHRVIVGLVAHQGLRVHLAAGLIAGVERRCGQIHHRLKITNQALPDAVAVPAQNVRLTLAALLRQPGIQGVPCRKTGDGHHEVAPRISNQALDSPLVIALAGSAIAIMDEVMRQEPAEQLGPRPQPRCS